MTPPSESSAPPGPSPRADRVRRQVLGHGLDLPRIGPADGGHGRTRSRSRTEFERSFAILAATLLDVCRWPPAHRTRSSFNSQVLLAPGFSAPAGAGTSDVLGDRILTWRCWPEPESAYSTRLPVGVMPQLCGAPLARRVVDEFVDVPVRGSEVDRCVAVVVWPVPAQNVCPGPL